MIEQLGRSAKKVLDVGCGGGRMLSRFKSAIGIDLCLPFLKGAKNYVDNEVILSDAHHLPLRNDVFDLAVMSEIIEHLENPSQAIKEVKRVLTKDGKVIISTPNKVVTLGKVMREHIHEFTPSELAEFLHSHGFSVLAWMRSTIPYIPSKSKLAFLNEKRPFFEIWKFLDKLIPAKWDMIALAKKRGEN